MGPVSPSLTQPTPKERRCGSTTSQVVVASNSGRRELPAHRSGPEMGNDWYSAWPARTKHSPPTCIGLAPMAAVKRFIDLETSPLMQGALFEFIRSGYLDRHVRKLRIELGERHRAAQEALARHMPEGCTWSRPEGGFALWVELPEKGQGDRLAELAANRGVLVTPGRVFDPISRPSTGIRLSLSRCAAPQIQTGVQILGECAHKVLETVPPAQARLFL